ncbi:unnamed protein product [Prorocentrum cordatum]|uniref:Phospholipid scramblase n=1 Tax=Prorocentrum cordatum TaxID=2364126 RepID=A0ABN9WT34_9DINO|nr:unnamed protein product [Polarella glacialis]
MAEEELQVIKIGVSDVIFVGLHPPLGTYVAMFVPKFNIVTSDTVHFERQGSDLTDFMDDDGQGSGVTAFTQACNACCFSDRSFGRRLVFYGRCPLHLHCSSMCQPLCCCTMSSATVSATSPPASRRGTSSISSPSR